jgi:hypothetical protein
MKQSGSIKCTEFLEQLSACCLSNRTLLHEVCFSQGLQYFHEKGTIQNNEIIAFTSLLCGKTTGVCL